MGSRSYSFLDTAALPSVGPRLAAGDALVILDTALSTVLWANGAGARLFGATDPLGFIGSDPALRGPVRRQIEATSGFPRIGSDRNLLLRLAGGLFSRTTAFSASEVRMPDGETGILLAAKPSQPGPMAALEGLSGDGQFAALVDGDGNIVAAADGFSALGIAAATLAAIAGEVRGEADRMVKRPLRAAMGNIPAGMALLRDDPPLSLLVVVEEVEPEAEGDDRQEPEAGDGANAAGAAAAIPDAAADRPETGAAQEAPAETEAADPAPAAAGEADNQWYFNGRTDAAGAAGDDTPASSPDAAGMLPQGRVELAAVPVRFVWRTDAEGRFSTISDEFRNAFGAGASDVVGRTFAEVARAFDLDPGGEIAGLLERRDTWSGRAVLWPVSGTDLRVPVDLAALPVYGRDRNFEGFRGFGVARMGDAVIDPDATGLALGGSVLPEPEGAPAAGEGRDEAEDPFRGEVPAIAVAPAPEHPGSDKVIRLAERRPPARDLSASEQSNFREIGEKLRKAGILGEEAEDHAGRDDVASQPLPQQPEEARPHGIEGVRDAEAFAGDPVAAADAAISGLFDEAAEDAPPADGAPAAQEQTAAEFIEPPLGEEEAGASGAQPEAVSADEEIVDAAAPASGEMLVADAVAEDFAASADPEPQETTGQPIDLGAFAASSYDVVSGEAAPEAHAAGAAPEFPPETAAGDSTEHAEAGASSDTTDGGGEPPRAEAVDTPAENEAAAAGEPAAPEQEHFATLSPADEMIEAAEAESGASQPVAQDEAGAAGFRNAEEHYAAAEEPEAAAPVPDEPAAWDAQPHEAGIGTLSPADELIEATEESAPAEAYTSPDESVIAEEAPYAVEPEAAATPATAEAESSASGPARAFADMAGPDVIETAEATERLEPVPAQPVDEAPHAGIDADGEDGTAAEIPTASAEPVEQGAHAPAAAEEPAAEEAGAAHGEGERLPEVRGVDTAMLARLPLPIVIHRGDALFYANREFLQTTGYDSLAELDLAGGLGALFGDPYGQGDERKLRLRRKDGSELPVDAYLQSVAWNGGKALLLSLKPAAEAAAPRAGAADMGTDGLEARLAELRTIIDTATDGVVLIENDGTIRSISRPAEALFGFEAEEVRGKPFSTLFAMESQRAARDYLASLADNGVASVLNDGREVIGREAQGRFIPLFMTIGRLPQESGYCAVVRDITQFKRAEEELTQARAQAERASSQKTDFLARVSHEIRTPLNAIIGFSELMLDEKFGPINNERYKDYLRDINRSGNHVLDLVNDLLDISKIEAGQLELNYEAVSLNETLADAVAMMQPQANRERVIIRSSFASRLPDVVADLRSIRQIALNLLSNAIRYTPAGGQVIISTSYEATGDILMRVRDTGIGMAAAEIEQALKPFKQINALKRPRGDGTGLGLPLTKAMVEANRARFAIQSTPGEGTLVEITFPSTRVLAQ